MVGACRLLTFVLVWALAASPVWSHELKVFSSRSTLPENGGKATVYLCEGHRVPVDELLEAESISRYDLFSPLGKKSALKTSELSIQANIVELREKGVYTVAAGRKSSVWTYVLDDSGDRKLTRGTKLDHAGKKLETATHYTELAKTLIVVGEPKDSALQPVGLASEIIPLDGPAKWKSNQDIRFVLIEDGKPVPFAPVVARVLGYKPDDAWNYATETNKKGEFTIRASQPGVWIIGIEYRKLMLDERRTEYDFAQFATTLTFEVLP